ncbi:hypothetical protein [Aureliella helgolandensis]|uniref:Uncharacterized protein n=1 Tax=Aureliella helgolandensis TaxID=2527968 RepID=A0A518G8K8_9BACT|nr:hypothetical protein [Aureliella helgolandensis]QDV24924.1 hypothetical protein Q31a_32460 [Aureliella helgolandensis]
MFNLGILELIIVLGIGLVGLAVVLSVCWGIFCLVKRDAPRQE